MCRLDYVKTLETQISYNSSKLVDFLKAFGWMVFNFSFSIVLKKKIWSGRKLIFIAFADKKVNIDALHTRLREQNKISLMKLKLLYYIDLTLNITSKFCSITIQIWVYLWNTTDEKENYSSNFNILLNHTFPNSH